MAKCNFESKISFKMNKCERTQNINIFVRAGALVQWLWEEAHIPKVVGLNPGAVYWMEMTFFTLICCKNCNDVCFKRPKINEKEARVGPFKKTYSLKVMVLFASIYHLFNHLLRLSLFLYFLISLYLLLTISLIYLQYVLSMFDHSLLSPNYLYNMF